jgi:L-fucose dehydrogenase
MKQMIFNQWRSLFLFCQMCCLMCGLLILPAGHAALETGLAGKVAIVTGGASGIGAATVKALAAEQAIVVIVDRDQKAGDQLSRELTAAQQTHLLIVVDLRDARNCQRVVEQVIAQFSKVDILVNNAGVNDGVGLLKSPEEFEASLQKNLVHYFSMTHYVRSELIRTRGVIMNVASKVAMTGQGGTSGYAASKGAILALTREWAAELAKDGVRVNAVVPAEVLTPQYERWLQTVDNPAMQMAAIVRRIPLGNRMTTAEEIANQIVFSVSRLASHTTGQHIVVDGGYVALDRALSL